MRIDYNSIKECSIKEILSTKYDIGIFPCGYERRSTFIASNIDEKNIVFPIVIGFKEFIASTNRKKNDTIFKKKGWDINISSSQDIHNLIEELEQIQKNIIEKEKINILIDYSSFSKIYYLNFLSMFENIFSCDIEITFIYSSSKFEKRDIHEVPAINYEMLYRNTFIDQSPIAIIGTSIDANRAIALIDQINANKIILLQSNPGFTEEYTKNALKQQSVLSSWADEIIEIDVQNFISTFSKISDITLANSRLGNVTIIPDGPKPLSLAMGMVGQRYKEIIGCMLVRWMDPKYLRNAIPTKNTYAFIIKIDKKK